MDHCTRQFRIQFVALTLLIMTLMSIERWLHMSRRTLLKGARRGCATLTVLLLIPFPLITVNSLVSGHPRELKKVSVSRAVRLRELFP